MASAAEAAGRRVAAAAGEWRGRGSIARLYERAGMVRAVRLCRFGLGRKVASCCATTAGPGLVHCRQRPIRRWRGLSPRHPGRLGLAAEREGDSGAADRSLWHLARGRRRDPGNGAGAQSGGDMGGQRLCGSGTDPAPPGERSWAATSSRRLGRDGEPAARDPVATRPVDALDDLAGRPIALVCGNAGRCHSSRLRSSLTRPGLMATQPSGSCPAWAIQVPWAMTRPSTRSGSSHSSMARSAGPGQPCPAEASITSQTCSAGQDGARWEKAWSSNSSRHRSESSLTAISD